jgi:ankyrin repeat protein
MTLSASEFANESDNELFQAIKTQQWDGVERLLNERPELAKEQDEYDNTPLHSAIGFKAPDEILLRLLEVYPRACQIHGTDEWLPLHIAAMWGVSKKVMEELILTYPEALDDAGQQTHKGRSPRHFSSRFEHNRELLERSTDSWKDIKESKEKNSKS